MDDCKTDSKTDDKTDDKTEIQTETNNVASSTLKEDEKKVIYDVIKNTIRMAEKSLGINKKLTTLAAKLLNKAWKLAELLVEIQHPGKGNAYNWVMCDKFCKRYRELEESVKRCHETLQKNLDYYNRTLESFVDIDKKSISQVTEYVNDITDSHKLERNNLKIIQEKFEYWQKDFETIQKDYKKYQIKLLQKQLSEYRRKIPLLEKKLNKLLGNDSKSE